MVNECGAIGGMKIFRGNQTIWKKPASVLPCPAQIQLDLT
jgi:hypothetical protein